MAKSSPRNYSIPTIKRLYALSGNYCAFPGCSVIFLNKDDEVNFSNICHIEDANPNTHKSDRYNRNLSDAERAHYDNLILLCPNHHVETSNPEKYSVDDLRKMKRNHEAEILLNKEEKLKQKHRYHLDQLDYGNNDKVSADFRIENIKEQGSFDFTGYKIGQVFQLSRISNGIDGYIAILLDSGRTKFEGGIIYDGYKLNSIPYFKFDPPCWNCKQSLLLILDRNHRILFHEYLGREASRIDRIFLYENKMRPTYVLTTDYSAGMGSYNGPISKFFEVAQTEIKYIMNGATFMTSLKSKWIIEHTKERTRILYKTCRPFPKGKDSIFISKLKAYEHIESDWIVNDVEKEEFWEDGETDMTAFVQEFSELTKK